MTDPTLLDFLLAEPGLVVCGLLVAVFAFVAWRKLLAVAREDRRKTDEWWASRQQYDSWKRVEAKLADPSSLSDDSPRDAANSDASR